MKEDKWDWHVARVRGTCELDTKVLPEETEGKPVGRFSTNEYILLKEKERNIVDLVLLPDLMVEWACSCECNNEPSGTMKVGEFLDQLSYYEVLQQYGGTHTFIRI
jgi:hypothetical protein